MAGSSPQQPNPTNGIQDKPSADSIDQVRDLLFGAQMRAVDARIQALEERMLQETAAIRAMLQDSVKGLDSRLSTELSSVTTRLQGDKMDRSALAAGLTDLAGRIAGPQASSGKQESDLKR
ncbi:MAG: hypothetical protein ACSLFK_02570 [Gemmatimonadaceae bacterium]